MWIIHFISVIEKVDYYLADIILLWLAVPLYCTCV